MSETLVEADLIAEIEPPVRVVAAEVIDERPPPAPRKSLPRRVGGAIASAWEWVFGLFSLFVGLALLATIPVLQLLSLGYLLEVSGRVARTGRLRDGFVGVRKAARIGSVILGAWLVMWPLRFVAEMSYSAWLIDPVAPGTRAWRAGMVLLTLLVAAHIAWAIFRGGRLRHFFWPAPLRFVRRFWQGGMYSEARDRLWNFASSLRLPYYFWLGARGFAGAVAWLFVPVVLLIAAFLLPDVPAVLCGLVGFFLFPIVVLYLPFLQAQFAAENKLVAMFDMGRIREAFRRAPIAFWFALLILLAFALPPYLLKIEFVEREVAGVESLVFVAFIAPARLLAGWAVGLGRRRERRRHFLLRLMSRFGMIPLVLFYALVVYLSRYTSWYGSWSLFEQHAFLLPVPFLGL